jgi:hypothetical protein
MIVTLRDRYGKEIEFETMFHVEIVQIGENMELNTQEWIMTRGTSDWF